jgi:hypothetical protein
MNNDSVSKKFQSEKKKRRKGNAVNFSYSNFRKFLKIANSSMLSTKLEPDFASDCFSSYIPSSVAPQQTYSDGTFALGDRREVCVPRNSAQSRVCVLNTLRTIAPALIMLRMNDFTEVAHPSDTTIYDVLFVLQDFFFKENELRMMVIDLHSFKLFDAFAVREDLLHVFTTRNILRSSELAQRFVGFYIKSNRSCEWLPLSKHLCSSVLSCKFGSAQQNFLSDTSQGILAECYIENPPPSWRPFEQYMNSKLYCPVQFPNLAHDDAFACPCSHLPSVSNIQEVMQHVRSGTHHELIAFVQPTIMALKATSALTVSSIAKPKTVHKPTFNIRGERLACKFSKNCQTPATCYWVECCHFSEPVSCRDHAKQALAKSAALGMVACPEHKVLGRAAFLVG